MSLASWAQDFSQVDYPAGNSATALAKADFDHDGHPDLVTASGTSLKLLLNRGDGTFESALDYPVGLAVADVLTGDVNADQHPDAIALAAHSGIVEVHVLTGNGNGTLNAAQRRYQSPAGAVQQFASGDFNRDGRLDLLTGWVDVPITGGRKANHLQVLLGDGAGSFTPGARLDGFGWVEESGEQDRYMVSFVVGDFNNDRNPDIAYGECCGGFDVEVGDIGAFYGRGDGTFGPDTSVTGLSTPWRLFAADVNQDGFADLAISYSGCHTPCSGIQILYGSAQGLSTVGAQGFGDDLRWGRPHSFAVIDANGDGWNDVLLGFYESGEFGTRRPLVALYLGNPDGSFNRSALQLFMGPDNSAKLPVELLPADFNRDGKWDFASANQNAGNLTVFTNLMHGIGCAWPGADPGLNVCLPASGSTVNSPVQIRVNTRTGYTLDGMRVYVDGVSLFYTAEDLISARLPMQPGSHRITVRAWTGNGIVSSTFNVNVSQASDVCTTTEPRAVQICAPINGASVNNPVRIQAVARSTKPVQAVKIYVDGTSIYSSNNPQVDYSANLAVGQRRITVKAWDGDGPFSQTVTVTVGNGSCSPAEPNVRAVTLCQPQDGATYQNVIPVSAAADGPDEISMMKMIVNTQELFTSEGATLDSGVSPPDGTHTIRVAAYDANGEFSSPTVKVHKWSTCPPVPDRRVVICSPSNGAVLTREAGQNIAFFTLSVSAGRTSTYQTMKTYLNGSTWYLPYTLDSNFFSIYTGLPVGTHRITAKAWDANGPYSTTIYVTVK